MSTRTVMAESHVSVRTNHLCCPICKRLLRDPATIPCGHNFCTCCIQRCFDLDARFNHSYRCPECRRQFPSRPQLIRNTTLAEVVRESVCASKRRKTSEDSQQSPAGPRKALCSTHNCPLDVYCYTDELIICQLCATAQHGGHSFGVVIEERRRKQEEIKTMQMKIRQILQNLEGKEENKGMVLKEIERHFESVRKMIRAQQEAAEAQVRLQTHQDKMAAMKKREAELASLAQTENNVDFLRKWSSLKLLCETDLVSCVGEDPLLPFQSTKEAVEKLRKRLEEFCDEEFASVTQTGSSGVANNPVEEPKTREEFLQYACKLSLDCTTAHENLIISEGAKEVMQSNQKCNTPALRSPQRFMHRQQVLCREGLEAERCYYEVEVKGDKVEIALAYKGMDRKSRSKLSAFGGNVHSWSLDRSKYYSVSHNTHSVQLTASPSHCRIGVYLKFKQGTLCFYEVSNSMKFLYKLETKFTEPLYPGFWLGEKCCIRICDLTAH
ncbi:tripartite motif-containing protein 16-like protein isoform X2 [Mugil cephalus]|uniref:tripartite motif-containing protein 16-like protein isoform X2 n=1 Tax=Mugil cephalus TaxID=48193 RepID=UPI001FB79A0F|nr:tripartite motif-containing protein 16-like protein isoform X2 [Mugil cephalus]